MFINDQSAAILLVTLYRTEFCFWPEAEIGDAQSWH